MCGRYSALTEDEVIEVRSIMQEVSLKLARDELDGYDAVPAEVAPTNKSPIVSSDNSSSLVFYGFMSTSF